VLSKSEQHEAWIRPRLIRPKRLRLDEIRTGDPVAWITCLCINLRSECSVLGHAKRAKRYGQQQQEKTGHSDVMKIELAALIWLTFVIKNQNIQHPERRLEVMSPMGYKNSCSRLGAPLIMRTGSKR
jgi:hypothetical protein